MSDEAKYTERDIVMAQRAAWARAANAVAGGPMNLGRACEEAKRLYPLTVKRPRVVTDNGGVAWKVEYGELRCREPGLGKWCDAIPFGWVIDANRATIFADLFTNPSEDVPE